MADQIYIGNFAKGLTLNRLPFNIDNDAFPNLFNFYIWRGRARRKRGTLPLAQLQRQLQIVAMPNNWQKQSFSLSSHGGNLISVYTLGTSATITPATLSLIVSGDQTYTDPNANGTLTGSLGGTGTINYSTGAFTVSGSAAGTVTGAFSYYPGLPVMGLVDFDENLTNTLYPLTMGFDTNYSYQIKQTSAEINFYNTTYYKNTNNPFQWLGQDYQQFYTTNYSNALWASNNVTGLHLSNVIYTAGSGSTVITFTFNYPSYATAPNVPGQPIQNLIVGDIVWFNEFTSGPNGISGTISNASGASTGSYQVTFATNITVSGTGIAQLLTNSIAGQDGIRWYDGDPTSGTGLPTGTNKGWVNFAPPLTAQQPPGGVSIDNSPSAVYYLVGALAMQPFKDRIVFFNISIQTSGGTIIQLSDTALWSWNGTPYYTTDSTSPVPNAVLVPTNQTASVKAYFVDQTGAGGYKPAGIPQPITTISNNEDVLLIGFGGDGRKTRFVYTDNDLNPFLFFTINSELPSSATFSSISLDKGAIDLGQYGFAVTDQQSSQRLDLEIPDSIFQIQASNNGAQRVNAIRDFKREWIYFSYPLYGNPWKFPTQTFLYNYRDNTWGILYENWTTHGTYRAQVKKSWLTLGYSSWNVWREAWNSGTGSPQYPSIIAGNPQGWVLQIGEGTGEAPSGTILAIASNAFGTTITSINHCVNVGDYLYITGCIGQTGLNAKIGKVVYAGTPSSPTPNSFVIDITYPGSGYIGLGVFTRLSQPLIQTKQFPFYWDQGRQVRLGVQKYLMDTTANGQVTVDIYLSQDPDEAWNSPVNNPPLNSLVYSQTMYTCPESTDIGLTPFNTNLQMPTAINQYQIWHRFSTSLQGDSVQIGITLSDAQMRNLTDATSEVTLHGMQLTVYPGPHLA